MKRSFEREVVGAPATRVGMNALSMLHASLEAVQPHPDGVGRWMEDGLERPMRAYRTVAVVGIGKAALPWVHSARRYLENVDARSAAYAFAVVPHGYLAHFEATTGSRARVEILEAGHPRPDEASVAAARRVRAIASQLRGDDLLLLMLSGGGTALCGDYAMGIPHEDIAKTFDLLLDSGANVREMNVVRKHVSRFSGGRLAEVLYPAHTLALIVSDVPGDDPGTISSGPVSPDASTFAEALDIVGRLGILERLPARVRAHLEAGLSGTEPETPKPGHRAFDRVRTVVVATNADARRAALREAERLGYLANERNRLLTGEARRAGVLFAREAAGCATSRPIGLVAGGETSVRVAGQGVGGRNQEFALSAGIELERLGRDDVLILSAGTDGIDGPTPAAGAMVATSVVRAARLRGLSPEEFLARNDSHTFFRTMNAAIETGPTHTNVMDLQIALVDPAH